MSPIKFSGLILLAPALLAQYDRFGAPACSGPGLELADHVYFALCHSGVVKIPVWVGYELEPARLVRVAPRPGGFRRDPLLTGPRAANADYRATGFSRGHMAPAADFAWSDQAIRSTFVLSNAAPQYAALNSGRWSQLEALVRRIAARSDSVVVYTGPILAANAPVIGPGQVAVPSHFFKVLLAVQGDRKTMYAAILPNQPHVSQPLAAFLVTVDEVERRTQLDFFADLDDSEEYLLESTLRPLAVEKPARPRRSLE